MSIHNLKQSIDILRTRIRENSEKDLAEYGHQGMHLEMDQYLDSETPSELEKAFFLILHQFAHDGRNYIVIPNEKVLVPDIYDSYYPGIEYEIDFALFGGPIDNPVKIAIECDGKRSHGLKKTPKDRRKDVNLQADGWIVMRFESSEIHRELNAFMENSTYVSEFLFVVENILKERLNIVDQRSYYRHSFRSKLTGFKWGYTSYPACKKDVEIILNRRKFFCKYCKQKFEREILSDEKIKYEMNGLIYFYD